jgi:ring-1,2-phenylacetyl-CoA epoxidase subunit PaaC
MTASANVPITDPGIREFVLAFADDEHMIGARHAEWIGTAPFLEEDLAFCSIAQDELGHALALYSLLGDDVDRFALLRDPADYRSCHLTERDTSSWDDALVRHWLYDTAERHRWTALLHSSLPELASLAARALREESFHTDHARLFLERVVAAETRHTIVASIERLLPEALGLWEPVAGEVDALAAGVTSTSSTDLGARWRTELTAALSDLGLSVEWPEPVAGQAGRTRRSDGFDAFLTSLQSVISIEPAAVW